MQVNVRHNRIHANLPKKIIREMNDSSVFDAPFDPTAKVTWDCSTKTGFVSKSLGPWEVHRGKVCFFIHYCIAFPKKVS